MRYGKSAGALVLSATLSVLSIAVTAKADAAKKYPDWNTLWDRGSPPGVWDPSKPAGPGQQAPLTAEYQKVYEENLVKMKSGANYDIKETCGPVGMPRLMTAYEPIEIVITPKVVYMLAESASPIRRDPRQQFRHHDSSRHDSRRRASRAGIARSRSMASLCSAARATTTMALRRQAR